MAFFVQPLSNADSVLGAKCFAYATLNALRQKDINLTGISTQQDANDWIKARFSYQDGGGSAAVLRALYPDRENNAYYIAETSASGLMSKAFSANTKNCPAIIGVEVGTSKSKHWVYMTGMGDGGKSILAEDQQNTDRGTLTFVKDSTDKKIKATAGSVVYVITKMEVFLLQPAKPSKGTPHKKSAPEKKEEAKS